MPDLHRQRVDVVHVASGTAPRAGEVLTAVQNANQGLLRVRAGATVRIIGADGRVRRLRVSGEGRNLDGGQSVTGDDVIVLYATTETVASLSGVRGFDALAFRLADTQPAAVRATVAAVRRRLAAVSGFAGFSELPAVRAPGDWPGKSAFDQFAKFFDVIAVLALVSALVLISNTITTLVAEQTSEIAIMRALGGRRRQIAAVYLKTALLLGAIATVLGIVLGIALANALTGAFGSTFAVDTGLGVDARVLLVSALAGLLAPPLAALPAIRRAVRLPLREALAGERLRRRRPGRGRPPPAASPLPAADGADRAAKRRPAQAAQPLDRARDRVAVGTLLAVLGLAAGISDTSRALLGRPRRGREDLLGRTPAARHARGAPDPRHPRRGDHRAHVRHRRQARRQGRHRLGRP